MFKVKIRFDYSRMIGEFHKNQEKVFHEIIKIEPKSRFVES